MGLCPCLCLSEVGVLLKRLNVESHKQHHTIAQGVEFSGDKDLREILPGQPDFAGGAFSAFQDSLADGKVSLSNNLTPALSLLYLGPCCRVPDLILNLALATKTWRRAYCCSFYTQFQNLGNHCPTH